MYLLMISIATTFASKPIHSDNPIALNIGSAVRTLVVGVVALGTGIFGIVAVGLFALAIQLLVQQFTKPKSSRIPPHEPTVLAEYALGRGVSAESFLDLSASVLAVRDEPRVCVCGSLYLLGEFTALRRERSFPIQSLITH